MFQLQSFNCAIVNIEQLQTLKINHLFHNYSVEALLHLVLINVLGSQKCSRLTVQHALHPPPISFFSIELLHSVHQ